MFRVFLLLFATVKRGDIVTLSIISGYNNVFFTVFFHRKKGSNEK